MIVAQFTGKQVGESGRRAAPVDTRLKLAACAAPQLEWRSDAQGCGAGALHGAGLAGLCAGQRRAAAQADRAPVRARARWSRPSR
jgi:hypothetical protein